MTEPEARSAEPTPEATAPEAAPDTAPEAAPAEPAPAAVPVLCARCTGGGWVASAAACPECLGQPYTNIDGIMLVCQHCHGTGRKNMPCPECGGTGYHKR